MKYTFFSIYQSRVINKQSTLTRNAIDKQKYLDRLTFETWQLKIT